MFINNLTQVDWLKRKFETPGIISSSPDEKRTLMARLIRSTRYEWSVLPKHTLFWQSLRIILYLYFFQSNTLKILYYRIKLSKRIKSILFILFPLKYLMHVSSLSTNEHVKNILLAPSASHKQYIYFSSHVILNLWFFAKKLVFWRSIYMYFILYLYFI